ncbi:MAG TPA: Hsp20/alpha crystallin family protein [Geminicoccaceae bacterium]|nr:Hsp20/alpha crystallin family protein [Geminicoccaceae bacterium]
MARDVQGWMWAEALELLDRAERMQRALFRPAGGRQQACWEPPVDVFESAGQLWIQVALPGVRAEQVELRIEDGALSVSGERLLPLPRGAGTIHRLELPHGRFERRIGLPAGHYELGRRELADGCLTIVLRKLD